jgi:hypothetical protein
MQWLLRNKHPKQFENCSIISGSLFKGPLVSIGSILLGSKDDMKRVPCALENFVWNASIGILPECCFAK